MMAGGRRNHRSAEADEYRKLYKTARWRGKGGLRDQTLARDPLCVHCLKRGKHTLSQVANHKTPHKGDAVLFFDPDNLEGSCKACHDGPIQSQERIGYSKEIGADGWPVDDKHPANRTP